MLKNTKYYSALLLLFLTFMAACKSKDSCNAEDPKSCFFNSVDEKGEMDLSKSEEYLKSQTVKLNESALTASNIVSAQLFDETIQLTFDEKEDEKTHAKWNGKVLGDDESYAIFVKNEDILIGNIFFKNALYQVRDVGNGIHQLLQINPKAEAKCAGGIFPELDQGTPRLNPCASDNGLFIDVMVLYTTAAKNGAGGKAQIEAEIYLAQHETNLSLLRSMMNFRIALVHIDEFAYTEGGDLLTYLTDFQSNASVNVLRDQYSADIATLIVETGNGSGIAYGRTPTNSATFHTKAFNVSRRLYATGYYTFGHGIGHNMGSQHDCLNSSPGVGFMEGHGFSYCPTSGNGFHTIMAYPNPNCSSSRIPNWSNSSQTYQGIPLGDLTSPTCKSNNSSLLSSQIGPVTNFRCSSQGVNNVWMKDTWNDTGLEPDPKTASQHMWESPYIWVRNTIDPSFLYQHQHENPEYGSVNFINVKLHNGSALAENGTIELWFTHANTVATWLGGGVNWTLAASNTVSIPAHSTHIEQLPWNNVPNPATAGSHFCMIARWVSATDPMTFPETQQVGVNVRQNNNIIWRNMNVVDFTRGQAEWSGKVDIAFDAQTELEINAKQNPSTGGNFISDGGEVRFQLDEKTYAASKGKLTIKGAKEVNPNEFIVTEKEGANLIFPAIKGMEKGQIELQFQPEKANPYVRYEVSIVQKDKEGNAIGGVTYDLVGKERPREK